MKSHYQVLDGLRGTAAFSVLLFHIWEMLVPSLEQNPMAHTFLAVDFFFALSGFVLPLRAWLSRVCLEHEVGPVSNALRSLCRVSRIGAASPAPFLYARKILPLMKL
jgi:peptidoglycan/LPS O-acetylase OafA/YrhL